MHPKFASKIAKILHVHRWKNGWKVEHLQRWLNARFPNLTNEDAAQVRQALHDMTKTTTPKL